MSRSDPFLARHLAGRIRDALADTPVVMVIGPRQAGKTTLCQVVADESPATFVTLDDGPTLAAAETDPQAFVSGRSGLLVIDEVQRAPALLPAIKLAVDRRRVPRRFLLTGSANVLTLPRVSESLAGRMEVLTLWTFSQGELDKRQASFVDTLFRDKFVAPSGPFDTRPQIIRRALTGGYPELLGRTRAERRQAWFNSYLTTIVQRDVRDLANIEHVTTMPRLLSLLAARAGAVLNMADLSRAVGLPHTTLTRYLSLLQTTFLVQPIPAWATGRGVRFLKSPRIFLTDTGLFAHLAGLDEARLAADATPMGPLLENLVAMEIVRQLGWSRTLGQLYHFRTYTGHEVDLVLEANDGRVVGIEIKAGQVRADDFRGLRAFREIAGRKFFRGVVLSTGQQVVPFGDSMWALPIGSLWGSS